MAEKGGRKARRLCCAIYTRKSSDEGLEQEFNSLHAQREACEAFIASQRHEGWHVLSAQYDDGGFSGGTMDRPALKRLLGDIATVKIDVLVVYKIDRLTRSLFDFAKIVEVFDAKGVSFVSVTQQFNTTTSMGRLTLNVLLSFAQFEREVTSSAADLPSQQGGGGGASRFYAVAAAVNHGQGLPVTSTRQRPTIAGGQRLEPEPSYARCSMEGGLGEQRSAAESLPIPNPIYIGRITIVERRCHARMQSKISWSPMDESESLQTKGWRLPAHEIEQLVLKQLIALLRDRGAVLDALRFKRKSPDLVSALLARASKLADGCEARSFASYLEIVGALVRQITVAQDQVTIEIDCKALGNRLLNQEATSTSEAKDRRPVMIEVPVRFPAARSGSQAGGGGFASDCF